ncbi:MAG: hypothetical protein ABL994_19200, partial [Verrucomicrobiales bacterium]
MHADTQNYIPAADISDEKRRQIEILKEEILTHLIRDQAHDAETATRGDWWRAVSLTVRGRMMELACDVRRHRNTRNVKRAYYLSLEYLMGRLLVNNLVNLEI